MSSMKVDDFYIDYGGMLNRVPSHQISSMTATNDAYVNENFTAQLNRIVDSKIDFDFAIPAKAGGLIVRCSPGNAEKIYDAVFGVSVPGRDVQANKVAAQTIFAEQDLSGFRSKALCDFKQAAKGKADIKLSPSFATAASDNVLRPSFTRQEPKVMRLAA